MLLRPRSQRSLLLPSLVLAAAALCNADTITYNVNQPIGAGGVTGDIITNGTIGNLFTTSIVDWNLLLNDGITTFDLTGPLSGGNSALEPHWGPGDLTATATQLSFNFSDTSGINFFYFTAITGGTDAAMCFQSGNPVGSCLAGSSFAGSGEELSIGNLANNTQFTSISGTQVIGTAAVPEPSTLILLGIALVIVRLFGPKRASKKHPIQ